MEGATCTWGAPLLTENFDYRTGDNITSNGWTAYNGVGKNPIKVTSGGLTYSGYASSGIGNAAAIRAVDGEDDIKVFDSRNSGSLYAAFLVNVSDAGTDSDYTFGFYQYIPTTFYGRVYIRKADSSIAFGLSKYNDTPTYTSFSYALNTTYLIVIKYTFSGMSKDDTVALYINPTPGGSEPSATITAFTAANSDSIGLSAFLLRQGATYFPSAVVDGIRVATSWSDAVAAATVTVDNTGAPAAGSITAGTSDAVLFGFKLTPSATVDFTVLDLTTAGTATSSDLSNFRVVYDADNSGAYDAGDTIVSASA